MEKSIKRKQKLKSVIIISLIGIIVGFSFTVIAFGFDLVRAVKGVVAGFIITFLIGVIENFVFQNKFKKLKFSSGLLIRTLVYVGVNSLKGFSRERFAGDAGLLTQGEIRLRVAKIKFLIPGMLGLSVFGGVGRVYLTGEDTKQWHNSFGGSIWMSFLYRAFNVGFTVAKSDEDVNYFFGSAIFL